jgi:hypothetical protein
VETSLREREGGDENEGDTGDGEAAHARILTARVPR